MKNYSLILIILLICQSCNPSKFTLLDKSDSSKTLFRKEVSFKIIADTSLSIYPITLWTCHKNCVVMANGNIDIEVSFKDFKQMKRNFWRNLQQFYSNTSLKLDLWLQQSTIQNYLVWDKIDYRRELLLQISAYQDIRKNRYLILEMLPVNGLKECQATYSAYEPISFQHPSECHVQLSVKYNVAKNMFEKL